MSIPDAKGNRSHVTCLQPTHYSLLVVAEDPGFHGFKICHRAVSQGDKLEPCSTQPGKYLQGGPSHSSPQEVHLPWCLTEQGQCSTPTKWTISSVLKRIVGPSFYSLEKTCPLRSLWHKENIKCIPLGASNHRFWGLRKPSTGHLVHSPAFTGMACPLHRRRVHNCLLYPDPMSGQPGHSEETCPPSTSLMSLPAPRIPHEQVMPVVQGFRPLPKQMSPLP